VTPPRALGVLLVSASISRYAKDMKRWMLGGAFLFCVSGMLAFFFRAPLREAVSDAAAPAVPTAQVYDSTVTSSRPSLKQLNLAVPFLSQAPKQNWAMPYQEACEEASMIMVDAYYRGRSKAFAPEEGDRAILGLVAFEERAHKTPDLTAQETADMIQSYFKKRKAVVASTITAEAIKRELLAGHPVIVPASGKALHNPNFHNGGPVYHMLVIKGYLADGRWITNDPGTRRGADYVYSTDVLLRAIHDWNGGSVTTGTPRMVIMTSKK